MRDLSVFDHENPMRDALGLLGIMGNPQHGETGLHSSGNQRLDGCHGSGIKGRFGLIEQ